MSSIDRKVSLIRRRLAAPRVTTRAEFGPTFRAPHRQVTTSSAWSHMRRRYGAGWLALDTDADQPVADIRFPQSKSSTAACLTFRSARWQCEGFGHIHTTGCAATAAHAPGSSVLVGSP